MKKKKILVLCPSPFGTAAAQRLKYEQYFPVLEENGFEFTISNFQTPRFWQIIHKPDRFAEKIFWTCYGYLKRIYDLLRAPFYDAVFITIWGTPLGPPIYEHIIKFLNSKIIYDLDDMMFINDFDHIKQNFFQKLKGNKKPLVLMKHASYVIVCTPKLEEIALQLNKQKKVIDISSTFNTNRFKPTDKISTRDIVTIGWTGTHSTLPFLESLQSVLASVSKKRKIKLLVIANKEYKMPDVSTDFISWNLQTEVEDLQKIDIGLYPIPMNEWSLGKSSLKALTYMAIGIPFVATAYGTNFRIMEDGIQGYMASNNEEWENKLIALIDNSELRKKMGLAGRKRVEEAYSINANSSKYLMVFNNVTE